MSKSLNSTKNSLIQQVAEGHQALTADAQAALDGSQEQQKMVAAIEMVGAIGAIERLADALSAQAIQAWEQFQINEGYKVYSCNTWVEFLEKHPRLGLTKAKYYERKKLLESEGAEAYDLLNSLKVPANLRKQLTAGNLQLAGNELIVGDQHVPINDAKKVKQALTLVIEQMERVEAKAARTDKENEKLKTKLDDAKALAREAASAVPFNDNTDPANQAYMRVVASLTELTRELSEMDTDEAEGRLASYRPGISQAVEACFTFSAATSPTRRPNQPKTDIGLSSDDLADLMED